MKNNNSIILNLLDLRNEPIGFLGVRTSKEDAFLVESAQNTTRYNIGNTIPENEVQSLILNNWTVKIKKYIPKNMK